MQHQSHQRSYHPNQLIDDGSNNSIVRTPQRVASPAMPMSILLQVTVDSELIIVSYISRASAPTNDQRGNTCYAGFTSSNTTCCSSNHNYLLQNLIGISMLRMILGVYCSGYSCLTKLYTVSSYAVILQ